MIRAGRKLRSYFILCFCILCAGCSEPQPKIITDAPGKASNITAMDTLIALLKTGDVVLRAGTGPFSYMLANLNQRDKTYSHCGIVVIEDGYPFIYHCIGGEDNTDERLKRDSASFFLSPVRNMGVAAVRYNMEPNAIVQLTGIVHAYYKLRPVFDPKFDLATDNELYCSEFVYKAFTRAMNDNSYIPVSHGHGRVFVGIDDVYMNPNAHMVTKVTYK